MSAAHRAGAPHPCHKRVRPSQDGELAQDRKTAQENKKRTHGEHAQDRKTRETHRRINASRMDHDVTWK